MNEYELKESDYSDMMNPHGARDFNQSILDPSPVETTSEMMLNQIFQQQRSMESLLSSMRSLMDTHQSVTNASEQIDTVAVREESPPRVFVQLAAPQYRNIGLLWEHWNNPVGSLKPLCTWDSNDRKSDSTRYSKWSRVCKAIEKYRDDDYPISSGGERVQIPKEILDQRLQNFKERFPNPKNGWLEGYCSLIRVSESTSTQPSSLRGPKRRRQNGVPLN